MNIDEIVSTMAEKVGISQEQAQQVIEFLKEHADSLPSLLGSGGAMGAVTDKLGDMFSGD